MIKIDGVEIFFDSGWKNIAVSLSGGADSTLLAYLLCDHIREKFRTYNNSYYKSC